MDTSQHLLELRLAMQYQPATCRRRVAGHDVIGHCHHCDARLVAEKPYRHLGFARGQAACNFHVERVE